MRHSLDPVHDRVAATAVLPSLLVALGAAMFFNPLPSMSSFEPGLANVPLLALGVSVIGISS